MRIFMTSILGAIFVLAGITGTAVAANFTDPSFGISIDVDDSLSKQPLLRDIQYFNSQDRSASLMIKRIHDLSIVEFLEELREAGYRNTRDAVILGITGEPVEADIASGRGLLIPVRGRIRGERITGVVGAYSGHQGQGFLVIGSAKPESWAEWEPRMRTMFNSIRFVEVDREAIVEEWENRLKGKKLQYETADVTGTPPAGPFYRGAAHRDYYLCSDGTVMRKSGSVGQVTRPNMTLYGRNMKQSLGTWHVFVTEGEPFLAVRDGREQELKLEYAGENFLLNGKRYLITDNELCD